MTLLSTNIQRADGLAASVDGAKLVEQSQQVCLVLNFLLCYENQQAYLL